MKHKYWIILIIVVAAIAAGIIYYANLPFADYSPISIHHKTKTQSSTTTAKEDLKDWKTYKNDEYGFEFHYPKYLYLKEPKDLKFHYFNKESSMVVILENTKLELLRSGGLLPDNAQPGVNVAMDGYDIIIEVRPNPQRLSLRQWANQNIEGADTISDSQLAGLPALEYIFSDVGGYNGILFENNNSVYDMIISPACEADCGQKIFDEQQQVYKEILSTFKFTQPQVDTSTWKTYRNEEYGFEFKYSVNECGNLDYCDPIQICNNSEQCPGVLRLDFGVNNDGPTNANYSLEVGKDNGIDALKDVRQDTNLKIVEEQQVATSGAVWTILRFKDKTSAKESSVAVTKHNNLDFTLSGDYVPIGSLVFIK